MPAFGSGGAPAGTGGPAPAAPSPIAGTSADVVVTQLTSTPDADESSPAVNGDGSLLLFVHRERNAAASAPAPKGAKKGAGSKADQDKPVVMALDPRKPGAPSAQSSDGARATDPSFLPEGSGYVYVSDVMGTWAVVRADSLAAGAAPTLVTPASVKSPRHPSVSSDGSLVAFAMQKADGSSAVATSRLDGSHLTVLGAGTSPAFSPDGARLVFVRTVHGHAHVHTMEAATGRGVAALTNGEADDASPSWSPDGSKVAFVSTRGESADKRVSNVFVLKSDGTELKQLSQSKGEIRDLVWGKDGNIYFAADAEGVGQLDLFRLSIAGEKPAASSSSGAVASVWNAVNPFHSKGDGARRSDSPSPDAAPTTGPAPASASAGSSAPAASSCTSCSNGAAACPNLPCLCNDRRVVNTKQCDNACCAPPDVACAASCRKHDGYSGSLAGGSPASAPASTGEKPAAPAADPKPEPAAIGKTCKKDGDCASNLCVYRGRAQYGYCTKECTSWSQCPSHWECENVRNGSAKYCVLPKD